MVDINTKVLISLSTLSLVPALPQSWCSTFYNKTTSMKVECLFSKIKGHTSFRYTEVSDSDTVTSLISAPDGHVVIDDC